MQLFGLSRTDLTPGTLLPDGLVAQVQIGLPESGGKFVSDHPRNIQVQVNVEAEVAAEALHDREHARVQGRDRRQAVRRRRSSTWRPAGGPLVCPPDGPNAGPATRPEAATAPPAAARCIRSTARILCISARATKAPLVIQTEPYAGIGRAGVSLAGEVHVDDFAGAFAGRGRARPGGGPARGTAAAAPLTAWSGYASDGV